MSHFTVMVIGADHKSLLAPFQETSDSDSPYTEFKSIEKQLRDDYDKVTALCYVNQNGIPFLACEDQFRNPDWMPLKDDRRYICPIGWTEKEIPVKQLYTWESYLSYYCGEEPDEVTNKLGYWHNPNGKWDWCEIGGRWPNFLRLKNGTFADQARLKDIDWNGMFEHHAEFWSRVYDYIWPKIKDAPPSVEWSEFYTRAENGEITMDEARKQFNAQPRVEIACELGEIARKNHSDDGDMNSWILWSLTSEVHSFTEDRAKFIKEHAEAQIRTFAIVKGNRWFEKGRMGWFAAVHDEKDPETWEAIWKNVIDSTSPEEIVTIFDCHV